MTLETMWTDIREWATDFDQDVLTPERLTSIINDVIERACDRRNLRIAMDVGYIVLANGTRHYAGPARLVRPMRVQLFSGPDSWEDLTPATVLGFVSNAGVSGDASESDSKYYLWSGDGFDFSPVPTSDGNLASMTNVVGVFGIYRPERLSETNPNGTNIFLESASRYVRLAALAEVFGFDFEDTRGAQWDAKAERELATLHQIATTGANSGGGGRSSWSS